MSPPARRNEKRKGKGEDAILEKKLMPAARVLPDPVRKHFGVSQFCQAMTPFLAFQDLMRSHNLYDGEPRKILRATILSRSLTLSSRRLSLSLELLPPHVLPLLQRKESHIERSAAEFVKLMRDDPNRCPKQPYCDHKKLWSSCSC